jgi:hypothetical protein
MAARLSFDLLIIMQIDLFDTRYFNWQECKPFLVKCLSIQYYWVLVRFFNDFYSLQFIAP